MLLLSLSFIPLLLASRPKVNVFSSNPWSEQYIESESYFWKDIKSEEMIKMHCSELLFPNIDPSVAKTYISVVSREVPIVIIDNFLPIEMCTEIISKAGTLTRSTVGDNQNVSQGRTSSTSWLHHEQCEIPLRLLMERFSRLVGLPTENMEKLQVVKYGHGEHFGLHTDHQNSFNNLDVKGRLATCLIYLNSSNEENGVSRGSFRGGATDFPEYGIQVFPRKGRAVFFFNTKQRPGAHGYDPRMDLEVEMKSRHRGQPVYDGTKWVANCWVHPVSLERDTRDTFEFTRMK